jgi:uncharacterized protein (TIGR04255 family)
VPDHIQLARPPLREALIHLQLVQELPLSFVQSIRDHELPGYENLGSVWSGQFLFQGDAQPAAGPEELDGWRYQSADGSKVVQVRRNSLTLSVLRGYNNFDEIKAATRAVWEYFNKWAGTTTVGKLAVRYTNVIELPVGVDLDDFLAAGPRIPPQLPQILREFLHQVEIAFPDIPAVAIITQAQDPPTHAHLIPVVLDIDVESDCKLDGNSAQIWSQFDRLRKVKNLIFFSSLTKRALEAYR